MSRQGDRGVSEVVGAMLLFGFLVISFTVYQGIYVPEQNQAIEFEHNQAAQDSVQDLRNAIRQTAQTQSEVAISVKLGADYPQRVIAVNLGASAGAIETVPLGSIGIHNVSASDPEVRDYFGATTTTVGPFGSKAIVYRPLYTHYTNAPDTYYENTVAFNQFRGNLNLPITDQAVIEDNQISLIALNGSVSEASQRSVTVDTEGLSTGANPVSVTSVGGPITVTLNTELSAANWTTILADEFTPDGHVTDVRQTGPDEVSILLEEGVNYDLQLAKVGVGSDTAAVAPKYIVDVEGDDTSVPENGTQKLIVEVRDPYNNPKSNVELSASSPNQGSLDRTTGATDSGGQAVFIYAAPANVDGVQTIDVDISFDGDGTANESVTFDVRVLDSDGSGSGGPGQGGGGGPGQGGGGGPGQGN